MSERGSASILKRLIPKTPLLSKADTQTKNNMKPIETLARDKKNFSLKNKNPIKIRRNGKRKETAPKYFSKVLLINTNDDWLFVKDKRKIKPRRINPKEKIEYIVVFFSLSFNFLFL